MTHPQMFVYRTGPEWGSLWLKAIEAVDLDAHCLPSLIGPRAKVDPHIEFQRVDLDFPTARAYYLCGVSQPYAWNRNGHLLAVPDPGAEHDYTGEGFEVVLAGLRPVPEALEEQWIDWDHQFAHDRLFHTCRNWRAAWWLHTQLGLRAMPNPERQMWARKSTASRRTGRPDRLF